MPDDLRDHYLRALHLLRDMFEQLSVDHVDQAPDPIPMQVPRDVLVAWRTRAAALPLEEAARVWIDELAREARADRATPTSASATDRATDWMNELMAIDAELDQLGVPGEVGESTRDRVLRALLRAQTANAPSLRERIEGWLLGITEHDVEDPRGPSFVLEGDEGHWSGTARELAQIMAEDLAKPLAASYVADRRGVGPDGLPLLRLTLPMSVELVAAIARGVSEELEPLGYTVHIGDDAHVVARPAERNT